MNILEEFLKIANSEEMKGWPMVPGSLVNGPKIPHFGSTINYQLETPNGIEDYTSIIRSFGWAVVFGVNQNNEVITLVQWKPGVNCASWELPPGGIGQLDENASPENVVSLTKSAFLKETGYGGGRWIPLGRVVIETAKYRGPNPEAHGLGAHLFLATGLEFLEGKRNPQKNEIIQTLMVPLDQWMSVLNSGFLNEVSAVACAYKALIKLKRLS